MVLGEFDLQLALAGASVAGEYVEDEGGAVDDLFAQLFFQVALLGGAEFVVEDNDVGFEFMLEVAYLFQLALADVEGGGLASLLRHGGDHLRAGGSDQLCEFVQVGFQTQKAAVASDMHAHQQGPLRSLQGP